MEWPDFYWPYPEEEWTAGNGCGEKDEEREEKIENPQMMYSMGRQVESSGLEYICHIAAEYHMMMIATALKPVYLTPVSSVSENFVNPFKI